MGVAMRKLYWEKINLYLGLSIENLADAFQIDQHTDDQWRNSNRWRRKIQISKATPESPAASCPMGCQKIEVQWRSESQFSFEGETRDLEEPEQLLRGV